MLSQINSMLIRICTLRENTVDLLDSNSVVDSHKIQGVNLMPKAFAKSMPRWWEFVQENRYNVAFIIKVLHFSIALK